jgi:hypothetical protein
MNGRTKGKHERQEWKEVSGNVVPSVDANKMSNPARFSENTTYCLFKRMYLKTLYCT